MKKKDDMFNEVYAAPPIGAENEPDEEKPCDDVAFEGESAEDRAEYPANYRKGRTQKAPMQLVYGGPDMMGRGKGVIRPVYSCPAPRVDTPMPVYAAPDVGALRFCENCGTRAEQSDKYCQNCGKKLPPKGGGRKPRAYEVTEI